MRAAGWLGPRGGEVHSHPCGKGGASSKLAQNDVIFILNLGQMDGTGQRKSGPKQLYDEFMAPGEAGQKQLKPHPAWQPLYGVPWA